MTRMLQSGLSLVVLGLLTPLSPAQNQKPATAQPAELHLDRVKTDFTGKEHVMTIRSGPFEEAYRYREIKLRAGTASRSTWTMPTYLQGGSVSADAFRPAVARDSEHVMTIHNGPWGRETYSYRASGKTTSGPQPVEDVVTQASYTPPLRDPESPIARTAYETAATIGDPTVGASVELTLSKGNILKGTMVGQDPDWILIETLDALMSIRKAEITMVKWLRSTSNDKEGR